MTDTSHIDLLRETQKAASANTLLFGAPLALVFAQLRTIYTIDSLLLKLLVTVAVGFLCYGLVKAYTLKEMMGFRIIREIQRSGGKAEDLGRRYVAFIEEAYEKQGMSLDEDAFVDHVKASYNSVLACLVGGYASLGLCLLLVIWSSP